MKPWDPASTRIQPWELVSSEFLLDCRIFHAFRTVARSPRTGENHTFFRLDGPDWVNIIAMTPDAQVVMVRQFRHGTRQITLEIPGGLMDPGEDRLSTALRELREETGYAGRDARLIGVVEPNPAFHSNRCSTFLVRDAERVGAIENEATEDTEVVLVPRAEIPGLIRRGEIANSLVVVAFYWLLVDEGVVGP